MNKFVAILLFGWAVGSAQIINIPDVNFKNKLLTADASNGYACIGSSMDTCILGVIDSNGNGEIEVSEAQAVALLSIPGGSNISDLTGIEYFTNLEWLSCGFNHLTTIDVSQLTLLKFFACRNNQITTLDLTNLVHLQTLGCNNNLLTSLDISHQPELEIFVASNNHISSFDFSNNPALISAYCSGNLASSLDFSANPAFFDLGCRNNPNLTTIKIRNGMTQHFGSGTLYNECWDNVPNLNYICADSNEIPALQSFLSGCGVTQAITIDSLCPLGVEGFNSLSFELYPNPSHGIFQLSFTNALPGKVGYAVYDLLGKKLLQKELSEGSTSAAIDMGSYSQGIYLLNVTMGNFTISKKLVKE